MSLLTNGRDTVTFVLADPITDHDGNDLWRVGTTTVTVSGASVFPIGSSGLADEGQTARQTASVVCRDIPAPATVDRLFYGHVVWNGTVWEFTEMPAHYTRSPTTAHWSMSVREVARLNA